MNDERFPNFIRDPIEGPFDAVVRAFANDIQKTMTDTNERKPLLSDEEMRDMPLVLDYVRDFYEAKITSGELIVVKTATLSELNITNDDGSTIRYYHHYDCPTPAYADLTDREANFCPGCGAKIVEG